MGRVVAPAKIVAEEAIVCVWGGGGGWTVLLVNQCVWEK